MLIAEFTTKEQLLAAIGATRGRREAYTPYEIEAVQEALAPGTSKIGWIAFLAGLVGGGGAFVLQWWINVVDYPLDIGGKADFSWPAFLPITFEMAVLFAGVAALVSAIVLCGLPRLYHPLFDLEGFERASIDRFFLEVDDDAARDALVAAGALRVVNR